MALFELRKLLEDDVTSLLLTTPGWTLSDGQISRTFAFDSYREGLIFATVVGFEAERANHHPDMTIGYKKVKVALSTHDVGGISRLDFEMALRISKLLDE